MQQRVVVFLLLCSQLLSILNNDPLVSALLCRMWMVSSTTPRTATALRSAFGNPSSAGVEKATKALRGFDTTPSTSTRRSLPTSSARCSSRECQHPHVYIQYKQNTSTSIRTSSCGCPLTLTLTRLLLSFLEDIQKMFVWRTVCLSLFYSFKSKTSSPPFSFHSSWGIFLYSSSRKTPESLYHSVLPWGFDSTSIKTLHFELHALILLFFIISFAYLYSTVFVFLHICLIFLFLDARCLL